MNSYPKRRRPASKAYKMVRNTILLNKPEVEATNISRQIAENSDWAKNWIEQTTDMQSECRSVQFPSASKSKLLIKWWEN